MHCVHAHSADYDLTTHSAKPSSASQHSGIHGNKNVTTPSDPCVIDDFEGNSTRNLDSFVNTLRTVIPPPSEFEPGYRNPCWHMNVYIPQKVKKMLWFKGSSLTDNEASYAMSQLFMVKDKEGKAKVPKTLLCIPKIFFIGFPKSGSSQLFQMMKRNPQIVSGLNKEPHWWTRFPFNAKFPHNTLAIFRYLMHYQDASHYISTNPQALAVDASQSTIWDTREIKNLCIMPSLVHSIIPNAKYIVIMRDPVDRLYSDFTYLCEKRWEALKLKAIPDYYLQSGADLFHQTAELEIREFNECLQENRLELCAHRALYGREAVTDNVCGRVRLGISLYHIHVSRWLKVIPRDQFLFLRTEDLAADPYKLLTRVWDFLGVRSQTPEELVDILNAQTNYSPVAHMKALQLRPDTRNMLEDFYSKHNAKLARILSDESFTWKDTAEKRRREAVKEEMMNEMLYDN